MLSKLVIYCACTTLALALSVAGTRLALAQSQGSSPATGSTDVRPDEVNHDVLLYLLVASNDAVERTSIPPPVDGVLKQLRAALPFSSYRLASTFLNRVKDGGDLSVSGVGGSPLITTPSNPNSPTFFNFSMDDVKLVSVANDQPFIRIPRFRFGLKVPVATGMARGEGNSAAYPVIQYQDTGISTEISVREGAPTVVGTLAASQPGESFVLVIAVKRTPPR